MTKKKRKEKHARIEHGGPRPGAGRKRYSEERKAQWGRITVVLKHDTIKALKAGADSRFVGEFLQHCLDLHPPPSREQYLAYDPARHVAKTKTAEPAAPAEKPPRVATTIRQALLQVKKNLKGSGRHFEPVL